MTIDDISDASLAKLVNLISTPDTGEIIRNVPVEDIKIVRDGSGRTVEAYAAVFNIPAEIHDHMGDYMEVNDPTAFNRTIRNGIGHVRVFYNHGLTIHGTPSDAGSIPIGTPLEIRADKYGLLTRTRYGTGATADAVLDAIRNGSIQGQSYTGRIFRSDPKGRIPSVRRGEPLPTVRRLEIGLKEYGPTPFPAFADAKILAVRSAIALMGDEDRAEILRMLATTPETDPATGDLHSPSVGDSEPGDSEPKKGNHSRRDNHRTILSKIASRGVSINGKED